MSILGFSLSMNTNSGSKAQYKDKTVEFFSMINLTLIYIELK